MDYGAALQAIGGLSHPEKMPWWAWSISANDCVTGGRLAQQEGTVCSDCYALKGRYLFPNVRTAHDRRLEASRRPDFVEAFIIVLTNLHAKTRKRLADGRVENRFRWFDSGDLQSLEMLEQINSIAEGTPAIDHWLPTRENGIVEAFLKKHGEFAPNLTVRLSAPLVGVAPRRRPLGLAFATVGCNTLTGVHDCKALAEQGNRCLDCDRCWDRGVDINYPVH